MPNLVDLKIDEVSLVNKAANRRKFLITKADDGTEEPLPSPDAKDQKPDYIGEARGRLVHAMLKAREWHLGFEKIVGCSPQAWKGMSKAEQGRQEQNQSARTQIEHLENLLDQIARGIKRPKESFEQAYVRAMDSPEGEKICRDLNACLALRR